MKRAAYLDRDERELAESLEKDEWFSDFDKKEKKRFEAYARYSLNKQRRINIRMTERDLKKIRAKAIEEGIPYQSLISMLIHSLTKGKLPSVKKGMPDNALKRDAGLAGYLFSNSAWLPRTF